MSQLKKQTTTPLSRPYFEVDALSLHGAWGSFLGIPLKMESRKLRSVDTEQAVVHTRAGEFSHVRLFVTPMDCSPPGSSVHGILQARRLEWAAISSCRGSSPPRDRARVSCISSIAGRFAAACTRGEVCTRTFSGLKDWAAADFWMRP